MRVFFFFFFVFFTDRLGVFISIFFIKTQTQTLHSQWKTERIWETEGESQRVEKENKLRNLEKEKSVRQLHQAVRQSNPRFLPIGWITHHSKLKDPFQSLFPDIPIKKKENYFPVKWPFWFLIFPEKEVEEEGIRSQLKRVPFDFWLTMTPTGNSFFGFFSSTNLKLN